MSEENTGVGDDTEVEVSPLNGADGEAISDRDPAPDIGSRFLFVDVAAQRTKQLRRGSLPRLAELSADPETGVRPVPQSKLERIAMREVEDRKIYFEVPDPKIVPGEKA